MKCNNSKNYQIQLTILSIQSTSPPCKNQHFYIATDGSTDITKAEYFCGSGTVQRTSVYSQLTLGN